ncbi:hypothetical protein ACJMK2_021592 [Sinanodonta woodiana]|uniref:Uncharacterized protein n=1 Tax=Sinanodonta woodiana TaxID=1069815 RepID=A0ABD3TIH9_SINWO
MTLKNSMAKVMKKNMKVIHIMYLIRNITWVKEENDAVLKHLSKFILLKRIPGKMDIDNSIAKERALCRRIWKNVKDSCRNKILSTHRK